MITIEEVYNLTKETMTNWEVEPTYSSGLVEANGGYQREKIETDRFVNTEEEVIKLIEITLSIATKLNIISEQSFEVQRLGKELANIGIPEA